MPWAVRGLGFQRPNVPEVDEIYNIVGIGTIHPRYAWRRYDLTVDQHKAILVILLN